MAHLKPNTYKELYSRDDDGSSSVDALMREVLHMIGNIDFEHEVELDKLERSSADQELKNYIRSKIAAAYERRREPYLELLTLLRQRRQRTSLRV